MPRTKTETIRVTPIVMSSLTVFIEGTTPLVINRFSQKAQLAIEAKQEAGSTAASKNARTARDFEADFEASRYRSADGWDGCNAASFRNGMISMAKTCGLVMTRVKLAVFVVADGEDAEDGTPLVQIYGTPKMWKAPVRNADGSFDIRSRARFEQWKMRVRIDYDPGILTATDCANLMMRVGRVGGIGDGRPDSKKGPGIGLGLFRLLEESFVSDAA